MKGSFLISESLNFTFDINYAVSEIIFRTNIHIQYCLLAYPTKRWFRSEIFLYTLLIFEVNYMHIRYNQLERSFFPNSFPSPQSAWPNWWLLERKEQILLNIFVSGKKMKIPGLVLCPNWWDGTSLFAKF